MDIWLVLLIIVGILYIVSFKKNTVFYKYAWYKKWLIRKYGITHSQYYITLKIYSLGFLAFFLLIYLQYRYKSIFMDWLRIDYLSIMISMVALYGAYFAFLQFLASSNDSYLGKNKAKVIITNSNWYQFTQTKLFLVICSMFILLSLFLIESKEHNLWILYYWKATIVVLLVTYIYLIQLMLRTIKVLFWVKDSEDIGLKRVIQLEIGYRYFKQITANNINILIDELKSQLITVNKNDIASFFNTVFLSNPFLLISNLIFSKKNKVNPDGYKTYILKKWKLIDKYKDNIDINSYLDLLQDDINTTIEVADYNHIRIYSDTLEFLFNHKMINYLKCTKNKQIIWYDTFALERKKNDSKLVKKFEELQINCIVSNYLSVNSDYSFKDLMAQVSDHQDIKNKSIFQYLVNYYDVVRKKIISNPRYNKVIKCLNDSYYVAYMLYQIMYPGNKGFLWKDAFLKFSEDLHEKICFLNDINKLQSTIERASKILDTTLINHRINSKIILRLFFDSDKCITDSDYFKYFQSSRMSRLLIIWIELLFNTDRWSYPTNKIKINEETQGIREELCLEYLEAISKYPQFLQKEKIKNLVDDLIEHIQVDMNELRNRVGFVGLLYYEFIRKDVDIKLLFQINDSSCNEYYFSEDTFTFLCLKLNTEKYSKWFSDSKFVQDLKYFGIKILDSKNQTIKEYFDELQEKLNSAGIDYLRLGNESKKIICKKLEGVLEK